MRADMFTPFSLNIGGTLHEFFRPQVMGILNITPDSFYAQSRTFDLKAVSNQVHLLLAHGADMIDIGAYSSRPGADDVTPEEELRRLEMGLKVIRDIDSDIIVSVDTFRADVAREAIAMGANIINDISGGNLDDKMFDTVASLKVPYILMHMRGTPQTMSSLTQYDDITADVLKDLSKKVNRLSLLGVNDVIVDPGFGFGKTIEQNFEMMRNLEAFNVFGCPVLVGISRKSMIYRTLDISAEQALSGTTTLNTMALLSGASILRVHDVKEARQSIKLLELTYNKTR